MCGLSVTEIQLLFQVQSNIYNSWDLIKDCFSVFMGRHTYLPSGYIKRNQAPVVQKVDSAIHRKNLCPVDSAIGFPNTYPRDDDLSNGQCYPTFEQPGRDVILALLFYTIAYPFLSGKRQSTYLWLIPIRTSVVVNGNSVS